MAQLDHDRLIERTHSGLKLAKAEGKTLGRPSTLGEEQKEIVCDELTTGASVSSTARKFVTSWQTVMQIRAANSKGLGNPEIKQDHSQD